MLTVVYDPLNGSTVPDGAALDWAASEIQKHNDSGLDVTSSVGTDLMLTAFRVLVSRNTISHEHIRIQFGDVLIPVNQDGTLPMWPSGLADTNRLMLVELMNARRSNKAS